MEERRRWRGGEYGKEAIGGGGGDSCGACDGRPEVARYVSKVCDEQRRLEDAHLFKQLESVDSDPPRHNQERHPVLPFPVYEIHFAANRRGLQVGKAGPIEVRNDDAVDPQRLVVLQCSILPKLERVERSSKAERMASTSSA